MDRTKSHEELTKTVALHVKGFFLNFGAGSRGGGRRTPRQNAGLQELKSRSSVHLPFDGFETVDVTLHRPAASIQDKSFPASCGL
jgi:hypothetical protein